MTFPRLLTRTVLILCFLSTFALAAAAQAQLQEGSWTGKSSTIKGGWSIVEENGKHFVLLNDDFSTKKAPDLKLFLSPLSLEKLSNSNATTGSVLIAKLGSHKGAQRYEIPGGVDLSKFQSLIVHCEKYSKLWGGADLNPAK